MAQWVGLCHNHPMRRSARRNPSDTKTIATAMAVYLELIASEAEVWSHALRISYYGDEGNGRAYGLEGVAEYLRTGALPPYHPGSYWPTDDNTRASLLADAADISPAFINARIAAKLEMWGERLQEQGDWYAGEALLAFAKFLRTGKRPDWFMGWWHGSDRSAPIHWPK